MLPMPDLGPRAPEKTFFGVPFEFVGDETYRCVIGKFTISIKRESPVVFRAELKAAGSGLVRTSYAFDAMGALQSLNGACDQVPIRLLENYRDSLDAWHALEDHETRRKNGAFQ